MDIFQFLDGDISFTGAWVDFLNLLNAFVWYDARTSCERAWGQHSVNLEKNKDFLRFLNEEPRI